MDLKRILEAINFATARHAGQLRKGSKLPYIMHPFEVYQILVNMGADEETCIAGLLHDTVEDTKTTIAEIRELFGQRVAMLVDLMTEDKKLSWESRKHHAIEYFNTKSNKVAGIGQLRFADKLSNLRSTANDYEIYGDQLWDRFNRGYDKQKWYYAEWVRAFMAHSLKPKSSGTNIPAVYINMFCDYYEQVFGRIETQ